MTKSITKTNEIKSTINPEYLNPNNWIAQDRGGEIFVYDGKLEIGRFLFMGWGSIGEDKAVQFLGKTTKTKYIKTYTQARAQLTIDNWWLDRYGRLIVEDRNTPNLLKEQA